MYFSKLYVIIWSIFFWTHNPVHEWHATDFIGLIHNNSSFIHTFINSFNAVPISTDNVPHFVRSSIVLIVCLFPHQESNWLATSDIFILPFPSSFPVIITFSNSHLLTCPRSFMELLPFSTYSLTADSNIFISFLPFVSNPVFPNFFLGHGLSQCLKDFAAATFPSPLRRIIINQVLKKHNIYSNWPSKYSNWPLWGVYPTWNTDLISSDYKPVLPMIMN